MMSWGRSDLRRQFLSLYHRFKPRGAYWELVKFTAPLAVTIIAVDIGEQALYRGLAGSLNVVDNLAAFGIAYTFIKVLAGATTDLKHASLVLVHSCNDFRKTLYISSVIGLIMAAFSLIVGLTPVGYGFVHNFYDVSDAVGSLARKTFTYMSFFPMLDALASIHTGMLLQYKRSGIAGLASVFDIIGQVVTIVIMLHTPLKETNAIVLPIVATYVGTSTRLAIVAISYWILVRPNLISDSYTLYDSSVDPGAEEVVERNLSVKRFVIFWLPLAFVQLGQRISRPISNLFVSRDRIQGYTKEEAMKAVAVLSVCYPIGHLPYGWLNSLRALEPAFAKKNVGSQKAVTVRKIRIFHVMCFLVSMTVMVVLFVIPGVPEYILATVSHLKEDVIQASIPVLHVFVFFPFPVINRAACTSLLLRVQKTSWLYPTVVVRIICILIVINVLPRLGVHGALMGISALISGFISESIVVAILTVLVVKRMDRMARERDAARAIEMH